MSLKNPMLKPKADSKRDRKARVAEARRKMNLGSAGRPAMEYDDGVSASSGGRGRIKASKAPSIRQRNTTGETWFTPSPTKYQKDNTVKSPFRTA